MEGDMIVGLYNLPEVKIKKNLRVHKAFVSDLDTILTFVDNELPERQGWKKEIQYSIMQSPVKLVIATINNEMVGFACYDSSAKGFFGPIGVKKNMRGKGIGSALLIKTLEYMKNDGYAYGIIGWVNEEVEEFYRKTIGAKRIEDGTPDKSVYSNKINLKYKTKKD